MYVFMVKVGDCTAVTTDDLSSAWTSIAVAAGFNMDELHVSQYSPSRWDAKNSRGINVMKAHLGHQRKKKREPKRLGKNICDLMFGRNMKSAQNA